MLGLQDVKGKKPILAPINKQTEANVAVLKFNMAPDKVGGLKQQLTEEADVLRSMLLVIHPEKKKDPTPRITPAQPTPAEALKTAAQSAAAQEKVGAQEIDKQLEEIFNKEQLWT